MKKLSKIMVGLAIMTVGVFITLDILGILDFSIFVDGWWALLIIIPCIISIFANGPSTANLMGVAIGGLIFIGSLLDSDVAFELIFPAVIIVIGLGIIIKQLRGPSKDKRDGKGQDDGFKKVDMSGTESYTATFSGQTVIFNGEVLKSCTLNAIFGGIKCDLTGAVLTEDIVMECSAVFGGIDLIIPTAMPVKIKPTSIFGGVNNKRKSITAHDTDGPCIYIKADCIFGGIDIK